MNAPDEIQDPEGFICAPCRDAWCLGCARIVNEAPCCCPACNGQRGEADPAACPWALRVSALADGEVADADKAQVRDHFADCSACQAQFGDDIQLAALVEGVKR